MKSEKMLREMSQYFGKQAAAHLQRTAADAADLQREIERIVNDSRYDLSYKAERMNGAIASFTSIQTERLGRAIKEAAQAEAFAEALKED